MSGIDDCLKSVERLTRDRGEVMRAGDDKIAEIRARHDAVSNVLRGASQMHDDRGYLLAEVERLRDETERLQSNNDNLTLECGEVRAEVERLHKAHQAACEGGDLLRAHNARLRAQVDEYFREPATHPLEET